LLFQVVFPRNGTSHGTSRDKPGRDVPLSLDKKKFLYRCPFVPFVPSVPERPGTKSPPKNQEKDIPKQKKGVLKQENDVLKQEKDVLNRKISSKTGRRCSKTEKYVQKQDDEEKSEKKSQFFNAFSFISVPRDIPKSCTVPSRWKR
jgi:hypothetical protein